MDELESPYEYAGEYDGEIYLQMGEIMTGNPVAYTGTTDFTGKNPDRSAYTGRDAS